MKKKKLSNSDTKTVLSIIGNLPIKHAVLLLAIFGYEIVLADR